MPRRPGDVGLYMRIGILSSSPACGLWVQLGDRLSRGQRHDSLFPRTGFLVEDPPPSNMGATLARHAHRIDPQYLDPKHLFDRCFDLVFVSLKRHLEGIAGHDFAIPLPTVPNSILE